APDIAARYLVRALADAAPEARGDVLYELAAAEVQARSPQAEAHLRELLETSEDPRRRAEVAMALAAELGLAGEAERPVELLERAIEDLGPSDRELMLRLEALLAGVSRNALAMHRRSRGRLARLEPELRGGEPAERLVLADLAFFEAVSGSSVTRACRLAERALGGGRLISEVSADSMSLYFAINALWLCDRYEQAERELAAALADARARGSLLGFALASGFRSQLRYREGLPADAAADARAAIEAFGDQDVALTAHAAATLAHALLDQGELDQAAAALDPFPAASELRERYWPLWVVEARGRLHLAQGRPREALGELLVCGDLWTRWGTDTPTWTGWRVSAALAHLALAEREDARRLAADELESARAFGAPRAIGIALRTAALVGGHGDGVGLLREAVAVLEGSGARLEHARTLVELGAALRSADRDAEAREPLRAGLQLAHRCGAPPLEQRARAELIATGARPRRVFRTGRQALTAGELRTARLAAEGMSNREIAQALFVTLKTVEMHLGRAYKKLEIDSRAGLAEALERSDLPARA
ncbi:MAG: LuxR C-terminal-related transcriptional regulator, partial [Actinomycetota bacterium]|nr:LuxR C-terminal-related transcriptional regulator [Actinomycetota bacterium]